MAQLKQGTTIDGRIALHEGNTHAVAKSGSYNDLTNKPTIHTINDTTTTSTTNTWSAKKLNDTFSTKLGSSATAVAANKLATARTIALGGDLTGSATFDGSANITISAEVKDNSHNHPYLPLTGGTLTGALTLSSAPTANLHAATKQYVDSILAANDAMVYKGVIDGSTNPNYPAGQAGFTYKVSVAGRIGGTSGPKVEAGDMLVCIKDGSAAGDHATVGANWNILQNNIDGAVTGPSSAVANRIATFDGTSGRLIKDSGFTIATSVPANAKFTDTVTTVNNTLTSDSTTHALSAAQGKALKGLVDGKAASNHTHNYAGSSSAGGNANAAVKLATARKIGAANFDGTANISTLQILGGVEIPSSGADNDVKFIKFATVDCSAGNYIAAIGRLLVTSIESEYVDGILKYYFKTDADNTSTNIKLCWETINNSSFAECIQAVKVSNGKYDLYLKVNGAYKITRISVIEARGLNLLTFHSGQSYVASITAAVKSNIVIPASTSTKLQTARTLTIGNTGKTFDGSANVSWSLSEIGAAASSHTHNYAGSSSAGGNANAAVKLATARTINGTSFDGSANITTANWGTARNITIGSSTKSVNGSANISWSLTEIGAAPSSHNHTSANITDATANATANMIVKRDGSGNASFNKSTVNSLAFGGNVTLQYNAQTESLDFVFPA